MDILLLLKERGRDIFIYNSITVKIIAWMHAMTEWYVFLLVLRISTEKVLRINPGKLSWEESFEVNLLGYQKVFCYIQGLFYYEGLWTLYILQRLRSHFSWQCPFPIIPHTGTSELPLNRSLKMTDRVLTPD